MKEELLTGGVGAVCGVIGTATQTNEILQTISLIVTIIGAVISFILVPILSWYRSAKKDGKITAEEMQEGLETLKEGLDKIKDESEGKK